jgi:hypothetical protein
MGVYSEREKTGILFFCFLREDKLAPICSILNNHLMSKTNMSSESFSLTSQKAHRDGLDCFFQTDGRGMSHSLCLLFFCRIVDWIAHVLKIPTKESFSVFKGGVVLSWAYGQRWPWTP